jgi:hypothetical protein
MSLFDDARLLRAIDAMLSLSEVARGFRRPRQEPSGERREDPLPLRSERPGSIEAHLGGVLVAALKETFDRDRERTEFERQHLEFERRQREADRRRADEALRLELVRQAGERETARLRLLALVAVIVWIISAAFLGRLAAAGLAAPVVLAAGWLCLLAGLFTLFARYRTLNERLAAAPDATTAASRLSSGRASAAADWLVLAGALLSGASLIVAIV